MSQRERAENPARIDPAVSAYAWRVLSVTTIGVVLVFVNSSTLDVALPAVSSGLRANSVQSSWFLLSYMLVNTVLILLFGRLSDMHGRRGFYLGGMAVLSVAGLACALAPNAATLIGFRALQGVGAAAVVTNTTALLTDAFPRATLSSGLGVNVATAAAAQVIGPLVGGLCVDKLGWRWVFGLNVPIGVIGLCWAAMTLRPAPRRGGGQSFDFVGAVLVAVGLGMLVVALTESGTHSWRDPLVLVTGSLALVAFVLFVLQERSSQDPLLDLQLFADRARAAAYASSLLMAIAQFAVVLLMSLYLQLVLGQTALGAGVRVVPIAAGIMLTAPVAGRLARDLSSRLLSTTGLLITAASLGALWLLLASDTSYPQLALALFTLGIGTGLFMTPNTTDLMSRLPADRRGIGNGVRSTLQNAGFVLSTAISLAIVTGALPDGEKSLGLAKEHGLSAAEISRFVSGEREALALLVGFAVLGAAISALRPLSSRPLSSRPLSSRPLSSRRDALNG